MDTMTEVLRQVSRSRKFLFYGGYVMIAAGAFLVLSPLIAGIPSWNATGLKSAAARVLVGLILIPAGLAARRIGIRGLAGSMVVLDPPGAKADLEPWSRAAGGLVDAAISEIGLVREAAGRIARAAGKDRRCAACGAMNDGEARFCDQCGEGIPPDRTAPDEEEKR